MKGITRADDRGHQLTGPVVSPEAFSVRGLRQIGWRSVKRLGRGQMQDIIYTGLDRHKATVSAAGGERGDEVNIAHRPNHFLKAQ